MVASGEVPDQHYFRGSYGDRGVIPLWRDKDATDPNITGGTLETLETVYESSVSAERLFAYTYGILAQPAYVERFWDELEQPPPRLPITRDADLFGRVADHGAKLLYLHTYGTRFAGPNDDGTLPHGKARCEKRVSPDKYPAGFSYDPKTSVLRVGDGEFAPVSPEVWNYSVSGMQVVKSWLDRRKLKRSGRKSSPLDDIRPEQWIFADEFLDLLWVVEATIDLQPEGAALLEEVCASDLLTQGELPSPSDDERKPPKNAPAVGDQIELIAEE